MNPGARIQAVIELLNVISSNNKPVEKLFSSYFRKRRYAGSSDRLAIKDFTYNILRHRGRLDWWIKRINSLLELSPRARIISELALKKNFSLYDIQSIFNGTKYCPFPLTTTEDALAEALYGETLNHSEMPSSVKLEYPKWMDQILKSLWSERLVVEMSALNQPAQVDVRVNTLKTTLDAARRSLLKDSIKSEQTPMSPIGLRLTSRARINETTAFRMGWVEVQDEGSQLIALLSDAKPGMDVVDLCAGAGGKTLALAATMGVNTKINGRLIACDVSRNRLDRIVPRMQRAGAEEIHTQSVKTEDDNWMTTNAGTMDRVLADVPCTATGTWRRNPVSRWQLSLDDLKYKIAIQRRILEDASKLVKIGGRLIYSTCSLLQEENEHQLAWFFEQNNNFKVLPIDTVWSQNIGGASPSSPSLRLSPATNDTDGFFCTLLEKVH